MVTLPNGAPPSAFSGPQSLRVRNEWRVLLWCGVWIVAAAPLLQYVFPNLASIKELWLVVIGAMIYVTFARGRLIGGSLRVHAGQFGHVHEVTAECARALRMTAPNVFVRDDPAVPIVAVGMGEPYSLIISAQWVDHLTPGELRFLIGRELAHIQAGHTRVTSLLSVNGRENAVISILFGAWLRRIEYTADRAGLLCCASLDDALSAIAVSTFHVVGRKIDLTVFAEQQREIEAERALRIGEWVSAIPYATKRIAALRAFARDPLFLQWAARFEEFRYIAYTSPPLPVGAISRRAFANFPRRLSSWLVDAFVVEAVIPPNPVWIALDSGKADLDTPAWLIALGKHVHVFHAVNSGGWFAFALLVYAVLLVGLTGQTFGMMIVDLRVVSERFARVGVARALLRYVCMIGSFACGLGFLRMFSRIQPFEKWSATRLIAGAAYTRNRDRITVPPLETASP